ncbi:MAG: acyl-CoA synthetase [Hydrogenophaga sp.]|uniref:LpxL/LpxP family acyltransferase n=1 Tax=Hydrogenophaga sp. TaxID=1904254 RepID=UPI000EDE2F84|nr:acyl-CoA synthetase [Hydrogenophaga sp.]MDD3784716.1 acyl-CoA synthetase [Hydrogenophaga sp.]HAJ12639.1 acyl-CoA synthetase [Comamonadaceae bacterium]
MSRAPDTGWRQHRERSHAWVLRLMVGISRLFGRRVGRVVLYGIAAYFTAFAPTARRASRDYLGRVLGREASWADGYRHVLSFASTVHDRVFLLGEDSHGLQIEVQGAEALQAACAGGQGVLLMGAHLGSFEVLRAMGRERGGMRVAMVMYEENARKINDALRAINPAAMQDIIPLGRVDSMMAVRDRLAEGCLVGMLADRLLDADGDEGVALPFLGEHARFPVGPWRLAMLLRRPVFFMAGLYLGGNRYQVRFEPLADFSQVPREHRQAATAHAMRAYVAMLERLAREAPYNWFNFYDFWHKQ